MKKASRAFKESSDKLDWEDLGVPQECKPQKARTGKFNYTIKSASNGSYYCVVEVQLANKQFYVKKAKPEFKMSATIKWNKFDSTEAAWIHVKQAIEWIEGST